MIMKQVNLLFLGLFFVCADSSFVIAQDEATVRSDANTSVLLGDTTVYVGSAALAGMALVAYVFRKSLMSPFRRRYEGGAGDVARDGAGDGAEDGAGGRDGGWGGNGNVGDRDDELDKSD